jgi:hypothetical protein
VEDIGGLSNGQTYYVIFVDANQIRLADSYYKAVGRALDNRGNSDPNDDIPAIAVTPLGLVPSPAAAERTTQHSLARNIGGLEDGQSYYVEKTSTPAGTFGLSAVRNGSLIDLDNATHVDVFQAERPVRRDAHVLNRTDRTAWAPRA